LDYYNKALDIFKRRNEEKDRTSETVALYYDIGNAYFHSGNTDKALFFCCKAFEFKKFPYGIIKEAEDDAETAKLYNIIGEIYFQSNQFEKALEQFQKTAAVYEKLNSDEEADNNQETALAYSNLGKTYAALEEPEKAAEFYSKAVPEYKYLALACRKQRKYDEALEWHLKAMDIYACSLGGESEEMGGIYNQIGGLYYVRHNYEKSLEWYEKALEICKQIFGEKHSNTANVLQNIADVFLARGNDTAALEWLEKVLDIRQEAYRIDPKYARAYYNRGNEFMGGKKDYDKAIADFETALRLKPDNDEFRKNLDKAIADKDRRMK
jgi:tetratricopeptide (TPR) repeat protein